MFYFLSVTIFIIYCIIIYLATVFFSILLDISFKKIHNDSNKYYETFIIWFIIVSYIYLFKEFLYYFHNNMLFAKLIKNYLYNVQDEIESENINETIDEIKEKTKYDILVIFCAIIPLIIINQEILNKNLKLIYSDIYPKNNK